MGTQNKGEGQWLITGIFGDKMLMRERKMVRATRIQYVGDEDTK